VKEDGDRTNRGFRRQDECYRHAAFLPWPQSEFLRGRGYHRGNASDRSSGRHKYSLAIANQDVSDIHGDD
jgi:hypothetical protein